MRHWKSGNTIGALGYRIEFSKEGNADRVFYDSITWANFALPMSTSSLAVLFAQTPHQFPGLTTIGKVIFIVVLVMFVLLAAAITTRFVLVPGSL